MNFISKFLKIPNEY